MSDIMDKFVEWFEREEISAKFDKFIATHAAEMSSNSGVESEQSHDWWPLYQLYQSQFEAHLETFLSTAGISKDEFLAAAAGASGINEMYLQIFLVHSEYETFVEQMVQRAREQQAGGEVETAE